MIDSLKGGISIGGIITLVCVGVDSLLTLWGKPFITTKWIWFLFFITISIYFTAMLFIEEKNEKKRIDLLGRRKNDRKTHPDKKKRKRGGNPRRKGRAQNKR